MRFGMVHPLNIFVNDSGLKSHQNDGWFKFFQELFMGERVLRINLDIFEEENWFKEAQKSI